MFKRMEKTMDEDFLDNDEFFLAEEIEGYDSCNGYSKQSCLSDCIFPIVVPTIVTIN